MALWFAQVRHMSHQGQQAQSDWVIEAQTEAQAQSILQSSVTKDGRKSKHRHWRFSAFRLRRIPLLTAGTKIPSRPFRHVRTGPNSNPFKMSLAQRLGSASPMAMRPVRG